MLNKVRHLLLGLIVCLMTGCASTQFTYNNLDWIVPWYLDDLVDLNDEQEDWFDDEFERLWQWHRTTELPRYAKLLKAIDKDLTEKSITLEKIHVYQDQISSFYETSVTHAIEQGAELMASLTDEQITEMREVFDEGDEEFKEYIEDLPPADRPKERAKRAKKNFRKNLGKLTEEQIKLIEAWSKDMETTLEYRYEFAIQSRKAFFKVMENRKDSKALIKGLTDLVMLRRDLRKPEYQATIARNQKRFQQLLVDMQKLVTDRQIRRLSDRLMDYAEDFEELAKETDD
jgi:hypothetical protein